MESWGGMQLGQTVPGFEQSLLPVGLFLITAKRLPLGVGPWEIIAQLRQRTEQR